MIRVLGQRNFALLWLAGLISLLGDWAFYTVVPVFVLDETGSVFLAGIVWAVIALPSMLVGPVAGVFVDRWDRRRILLWGNLAQAGAAAILLLAGATPGVWIAMAVLLVNASIASMLLPAENALLPTLVRSEDLTAANTLNAMNDNLARIAGPPVGALLYASLGIEGVAVANAASFLLAAGLVGALRRHAHPGKSAPAVGHEAFWLSLRTGARVVRHHHVLGAIVLVVGLVAFADGPIAAMIAPWVDTTLDKGVEGVGVFTTVRGVAGILGGIVIGMVGTRVRELRLLTVSAALNGFGFVAMAVADDFTIACLILLVVIGPSHIGLHTTLTTLLQRNSEDRYRGRVLALNGALAGALFLIGTVGGSAAGSAISPPAVIAVCGLLLVGTAVVAAILLPATRESE